MRIVLFFLLIHSCQAASGMRPFVLPSAFADCQEIVAAARGIDEAQAKYATAVRNEIASWGLARLAPIVLDADPRTSDREKFHLVSRYNERAGQYLDNRDLSNWESLYGFAVEMAETRARLKTLGLLPAAAPVTAPVAAPVNGEASTPKKKIKIRAKLADGTVIEE